MGAQEGALTECEQPDDRGSAKKRGIILRAPGRTQALDQFLINEMEKYALG